MDKQIKGLNEKMWNELWPLVDGLQKSGFGRHKIIETACQIANEFLTKLGKETVVTKEFNQEAIGRAQLLLNQHIIDNIENYSFEPGYKLHANGTKELVETSPAPASKKNGTIKTLQELDEKVQKHYANLIEETLNNEHTENLEASAIKYHRMIQEVIVLVNDII